MNILSIKEFQLEKRVGIVINSLKEDDVILDVNGLRNKD